MHSRSSLWLFSMFVTLGLSAAAQHAHAQQGQQCTQDTDCNAGLVCMTTVSSNHVSAQCQLPGCKTDADCPDHTVCHGSMQCNPDSMSSPGGCVSETVMQCAYKYDLPCAVAADCHEQWRGRAFFPVYGERL